MSSNTLTNTITLSDCQKEIVRDLAKKRQEYDEKNGCSASPYVKGKSLLESNTDALGAEFAVAIAYNVMPDLGYNNFKPYDLVICGSTVDVKQTANTVELHVKDLPRVHTDKCPQWFLLVTGTLEKGYKIHGSMSASSIINQKHQKSMNSYGKPLPSPMFVGSYNELVQI